MPDNIIQSMNTLSALAGGNKTLNPQNASGLNFQSMVKESIRKVDDAQKISGDLKNRFAQGEDIAVEDIMIASNEASIYFTAFQTTTQKLLDAYKEISSMSV